MSEAYLVPEFRVGVGRRRLLARGLTVGAALAAAGLAGAGVVPAATASSLVSASRIGRNPGWPLRRRTGLATIGGRSINQHNTGESFLFDPVFRDTCDDWAVYFNAMWSTYASSTISLAWIGCSHVYRSYPAGSNHTTGNAFDLTAMYFDNGGYIDCNFSHRDFAPVVHQRWYVGLAWTGRRFFPELGIVGTGTNHDWHIHMGRYKNGSPSILLSRGSWDTWLVQRTCKVLMQVNIALDGQWGPQTESYYQTLMSRLGLNGYNPFTTESHLAAMVYRIVAKGLAGSTV